MAASKVVCIKRIQKRNVTSCKCDRGVASQCAWRHALSRSRSNFSRLVGTTSGFYSEKVRQKLRKMTHIRNMQYPNEFDFIPTRRLGSTESGIPCGKEQSPVFVTSFDRGLSEDHRGIPLLLSTARSSY